MVSRNSSWHTIYFTRAAPGFATSDYIYIFLLERQNENIFSTFKITKI